ncbi:hypothetical protein AYP92_08115 [Lactobacillus crispatus]|uniref:hypothetical protein n=1 Tax=Lactobacillus TaxID=1578 RepID=UPI000B5DB469|nr:MULTISPECIES: hypothetical protein [Lactobacillus]OXC23214.1 hypothetical protein AYP83_01305 [Lactobacillus crispatus]OXC42715.1 hypothetical protein AYP92_08115 [Lactobacillus crispatus]PEH12450.1 hypothetical protein CP352_03145 [Lactobacillus sp. UMNPBX1]
MTDLNSLFLQMWVLDFQMGLFKEPYFQGLVRQGLLTTAGYKEVTGEDYVAPQAQPSQPAAQA